MTEQDDSTNGMNHTNTTKNKNTNTNHHHNSPSPKRARRTTDRKNKKKEDASSPSPENTNESVTRHPSDEESCSSSSSSRSNSSDNTNINSKSKSNDTNRENEENSDDDDDEGISIDLDSLDQESLMALLSQISASQNIPLSVLWQSLGQYPPYNNDDSDMEYPFITLPNQLQQVAAFISSDQCRRILILAGAGMSVAAGIPDYRSENGFYATLSAQTLTATPQQQHAIQQDKTVALDQHLFLENPLPCLELKRDFILGVHEKRWKPTLAHHFCALLAQQQQTKLVRWYTQNIDGLEDAALGDKVIHVHGTMSQADCAHCGAVQDAQAFHQHVQTNIKDVTGQDPTAPSTSRPMVCTHCQKPAVKPAIVLFRSSLPRVFHDQLPHDVQDIDLLLVLGTSLRVAPANSIVWRVPSSCLRVVINREPVGQHLGIRHLDEERKRDFHAAGDCEETVLELMEHLGWLPLLEDCVDDLPPSSAQLLRDKLNKQQQQPCDLESGKRG